jgi:hypothetical protein
MSEQIKIDTLRGELREEQEVVAALEESKRDAERILSKKILELSERTAERDQLRRWVTTLLTRINAHRDGMELQAAKEPDCQITNGDRDLYQAADQVRKELEG